MDPNWIPVVISVPICGLLSGIIVSETWRYYSLFPWGKDKSFYAWLVLCLLLVDLAHLALDIALEYHETITCSTLDLPCQMVIDVTTIGYVVAEIEVLFSQIFFATRCLSVRARPFDFSMVLIKSYLESAVFGSEVEAVDTVRASRGQPIRIGRHLRRRVVGIAT